MQRSSIFAAAAVVLITMSGNAVAMERLATGRADSVIETKARFKALKNARSQLPRGAENIRPGWGDCTKDKTGYVCEVTISFETPDDPVGQGVSSSEFSYGRVEGEELPQARPGRSVSRPAPSKTYRVNESDREAYDSFMGMDDGNGVRRDGTLASPVVPEQPSEASSSDAMETAGAALSTAGQVLGALVPLASGIAAQRAVQPVQRVTVPQLPRPAQRAGPMGDAPNSSSGISGTDKIERKR